MSRYIDADKIKYHCKKSHECLSNAECEYCDHYTVCKVDIDIIPTAEVKPIEDGEWKHIVKGFMEFGEIRCSKCCWKNDFIEEFSFCPSCGAKMKKEKVYIVVEE